MIRLNLTLYFYVKINFSDYDLENFVVDDGIFCGVAARLITPNADAKFTQKNKIFRSSIWDLEGNLLSASFPKFTNWLENAENFPVPTDFDKCNFLTKIDGSALIIDCVDHIFNMRTRGCFSYQSQHNYQDFEFVMKKYPLVQEFIRDFKQFSLIFEIVTPNQLIVINYGKEPDIYLIGAIYKNDYSLATQKVLDVFAMDMKVKRSDYYQFPSFEKMLESVPKEEGKEGVCVYSNFDQNIHKCKTDWYLLRHRLKSQFASFNNIIEAYLTQKHPNYDDFYDFIKKIDYELAETLKEKIFQCCELGKNSQNLLDEMAQFVSNLDKTSRKDCALKIIEEYREKGLDSFAFNFLSGKLTDDKIFKKLMEKLLDEEKIKEN